MTAPLRSTHSPILLPETGLTRHRACTAPDLTPEQFAEAVRFEAAEPAPESWTPPLCSCGRCAGRGRLRIDTAGVESWVPCRMVGGPRYLPAAAAGDWWKS